MGFTTNYQIPYPELTDIPDGAGQMKALAQQVDVQMKAQIATAATWTPTFTNFTLGNGVVATAAYRKVGSLCFAYLRVNAAASAPTTAFTAGYMTVNVPLPIVVPGAGTVWFFPGSARPKLGATTAAGSAFEIHAVKQADLTLESAGAVWGTSAWAVGANLQLSFVYGI